MKTNDMLVYLDLRQNINNYVYCNLKLHLLRKYPAYKLDLVVNQNIYMHYISNLYQISKTFNNLFKFLLFLIEQIIVGSACNFIFVNSIHIYPCNNWSFFFNWGLFINDEAKTLTCIGVKLISLALEVFCYSTLCTP